MTTLAPVDNPTPQHQARESIAAKRADYYGRHTVNANGTVTPAQPTEQTAEQPQ